MPKNATTGASCTIYPINHPTLPKGLPSQEYKHHTFKSTTTSAIQEIVIIESHEGTAFEIVLDMDPDAYSAFHQISDYPPKDDYLIYVYLDGIKVQRSKRHHSQRGPTRISGVYSADHRATRPFQFGKLHLVDPDDYQSNLPDHQSDLCEDEKVIQALGTIQVNIVRCCLGHPVPVPRKPYVGSSSQSNSNSNSKSKPAPNEDLQTSNQMKFSERTKKACQMNNTVGLGDPILNSAREGGRGPFRGKKSARPVTFEDPHPFLQFIFKYKPRSVLEADNIIIPPPPPPPSPPRQVSASANHETTITKPTNDPLPGKIQFGKPKNSNTTRHYSHVDVKPIPGIEGKKPTLTNQVDEKKPGHSPSPNYIEIDSDSDSENEALNDENTKSGPSSQTNLSSSVSRPIKPDHDEAGASPTRDSKKRFRSTIDQDVKPSKKLHPTPQKAISIKGASAAASRTSQTDCKGNISKREPAGPNNEDNSDSSDDDDKFKHKILGNPTESKNHLSRNLDPLSHVKVKDEKKVFDSKEGIKTISLKEQSNFFDLTGLDDDDD